MQRANRDENVLRNAISILNEYVNDKKKTATFNSLKNGVLELKTGRTMEVDGEYSFVKPFGKAYSHDVSENKTTAIAQMNENPLYTFWKEYSIANTNPDAR